MNGCLVAMRTCSSRDYVTTKSAENLLILGVCMTVSDDEDRRSILFAHLHSKPAPAGSKDVTSFACLGVRPINARLSGKTQDLKDMPFLRSPSLFFSRSVPLR